MNARNVIAWILQILLGAAFIFVGGGKFWDLPKTLDMFAKLGLPAFVAYLVAGGELLGGIGLLVPRLVRPAAAGLIIIMLGAAFMHATKIPGGLLPNGMASLLLLLLLVVLFVLRRPADAAA